MKYKIYASLHEEIDAGWIWLLEPELPPRCVIKITSLRTGKNIFCEALQIDDNFLSKYNGDPRRHKIEDSKSALVMNTWYRKYLGDIPTQSEQDLKIIVANSRYGKFRACLSHPQIVVRVGTWLGIISICLGSLGIIIGLVLGYLGLR